MRTPSGPLHGYELAFLRAGNILIRDYGSSFVMLWLTPPARIAPSRWMESDHFRMLSHSMWL